MKIPIPPAIFGFLTIVTISNAQVTMREMMDDVRSVAPPKAFAAVEVHGEHDFQDIPGDTSWTIYEAKVPFYFKRLSDGVNWAAGIDWTTADLDINGGELPWSGQLHSLYIPVSFTYRKEGSRWFWLGQAAPGLRTDFESIDGDDFAFRTFAGAMRQMSDTLNFGFGAYFSYDSDEIFAAPGIGFTWKPADQWLVSLIPPQLAVTYLPSEEWLFSLSLRPRSFFADLDEGEDGPDLARVKYGRLGLSAKRKLTDWDGPNLWLSVNGGYTIYSEVELERDGQSLVDGETDQGFYAGASLELLGW